MGRLRHRDIAVPIEQSPTIEIPVANSPWPRIVAAVLIVAFFIIVRAQLLNVPLDRDEGGYAYAGAAILRGETPYRDVVDQKPPGLFYVFALAALFPETAAGLHTFLALWLFAGLVAIGVLAHRMFDSRVALWAAGLFGFLTATPSVQGFTASAEPLGLVPLAASLALVVIAARREGRARDLLMVVAGVLAASAFLIKPPLAVPLLATPLLARASGGDRWKRDVAAWLAGGVAVGLIVAAVVTAAGLWKEFWYWNSTHTSTYRKQSWEVFRERLAAVVKFLPADFLLPLILGILGCIRAAVKRNRHALFLAVFLVLSAISCFQAGYLYLHYFSQVTLALALAGGVGAVAVMEAVSRNAAMQRAAAAVLALVVLAVPVAARPWYWIKPDPLLVSLQVLGPQAFEASPLLAEHLREKTAPGDPVWVFGNEPQILYMADRRSAMPFLFTYPLLSSFPREREFQESAWSAVQKANPAVILVVREPALLQKVTGADPFLERQLAAMRSRYEVDSCLSLGGQEGLVLHTQLDVKRISCPGRPVMEFWRRRDHRL